MGSAYNCISHTVNSFEPKHISVSLSTSTDGSHDDKFVDSVVVLRLSILRLPPRWFWFRLNCVIAILHSLFFSVGPHWKISAFVFFFSSSFSPMFLFWFDSFSLLLSTISLSLSPYLSIYLSLSPPICILSTIILHLPSFLSSLSFSILSYAQCSPPHSDYQNWVIHLHPSYKWQAHTPTPTVGRGKVALSL